MEFLKINYGRYKPEVGDIIVGRVIEVKTGMLNYNSINFIESSIIDDLLSLLRNVWFYESFL